MPIIVTISLLLARLCIVYGARLLMVAGVRRRRVCNAPRRNVTHQGAARGGPVVLNLVRVTPCLIS